MSYGLGTITSGNILTSGITGPTGITGCSGIIGSQNNIGTIGSGLIAYGTNSITCGTINNGLIYSAGGIYGTINNGSIYSTGSINRNPGIFTYAPPHKPSKQKVIIQINKQMSISIMSIDTIVLKNTFEILTNLPLVIINMILDYHVNIAIDECNDVTMSTYDNVHVDVSNMNGKFELNSISA